MYQLALLSDQASTIIQLCLSFIMLEVSNIDSAISTIFYALALLSLCYAVIAPMIGRASDLKDIVVRCILGAVLITPIDANISDGQNNVPLPMGVYVPWSAMYTALDALGEGIKLIREKVSKGEGTGRALLTSALIKTKTDIFDNHWQFLATSYHEYTTRCTNVYNKVPTKVKNAFGVTDANIALLGLNYGNGLFIDSMGSKVDNDIRSLFNQRKELEKFLTDEKGMSAYELPVDYTLYVAFDGVYVSPYSSSDLVDFTYENSHQRSKDDHVIATSPVSAEQKTLRYKQASEKNYNAFYLETCKNLYAFNKHFIQKMKDELLSKEGMYAMILGSNTSVKNDVMQTRFRGALEAATNGSDTSVKDMATMMLIKYYKGNGIVTSEQLMNRSGGHSTSQSFMRVNNTPDNEAELGKLIQDIEGFQNWMKGVNLQYLQPFMTTGVAICLALSVVLLMVLLSITPVMGFGILLNGYLLTGMMFLSLVIFQLMTSIAAAIMDHTHDVAVASLIGNGPVFPPVLMLYSKIGLVATAISVGLCLIISFALIKGNADTMRNMKMDKNANATTVATTAAGVAAASAALTTGNVAGASHTAVRTANNSSQER